MLLCYLSASYCTKNGCGTFEPSPYKWQPGTGALAETPRQIPGPFAPRHLRRHFWQMLAGLLGPFGPILGPFGPILGPYWAHLGPFGPILGPYGPILGPYGFIFNLSLYLFTQFVYDYFTRFYSLFC